MSDKIIFVCLEWENEKLEQNTELEMKFFFFTDRARVQVRFCSYFSFFRVFTKNSSRCNITGEYFERGFMPE